MVVRRIGAIMKLTQKEKADRYDSLMVAIEYYRTIYKDRARVYEEVIKNKDDMNVLDSFNYGMAKCYEGVVEDMGAWL